MPHHVLFYCIIIYLYNLLAQGLEHPAEAGEHDAISVIASSPLIAFHAPLFTPPPFTTLPCVIPLLPLQRVVITVHSLNIKMLTIKVNNTTVSNS